MKILPANAAIAIMLIIAGSAAYADGTAVTQMNGNGIYAYVGSYLYKLTDNLTTNSNGARVTHTDGISYNIYYNYTAGATALTPVNIYKGSTLLQANSVICNEARDIYAYRLEGSDITYNYSYDREVDFTLPEITVFLITSATTTDRDGDGTDDDKDEDPDDPTKNKKDSDGDGVDDDNDCDPSDPANTGTKPNCYKCDDDSYATDAASCESTHDYNLDGEEPNWDQLKADIKTDMLRLGIDFDVLKDIQTENKALLLKYPNGGTSISNITYGEIDLGTNPETWENGIFKDLMINGQSMIKTIGMFLLTVYFIIRVARLMFEV